MDVVPETLRPVVHVDRWNPEPLNRIDVSNIGATGRRGCRSSTAQVAGPCSMESFSAWVMAPRSFFARAPGAKAGIPPTARPREPSLSPAGKPRGSGARPSPSSGSLSEEVYESRRCGRYEKDKKSKRHNTGYFTLLYPGTRYRYGYILYYIIVSGYRLQVLYNFVHQYIIVPYYRTTLRYSTVPVVPWSTK